MSTETTSDDVCYNVNVATTFTRVRIGWGAIDYATVQAETPQYASTQYAYAGPSAAAGAGVGVRRATLIVDRSTLTPTDDDMNMHFDFMNITSGEPDDTWTSADYAALEARLITWYTSQSILFPTYSHLNRIAWHRVGPGVAKPNPAERLLTLTTPIAGSGGTTGPAQCACTLTLRTGIRRSWGRTYLPVGGPVGTNGRFSTTLVDNVVAFAKTLRDGAASDDFLMGVLSVARSSFLGVETLEADDVPDVVRRRRFKHTTYRKLTAIT